MQANDLATAGFIQQGFEAIFAQIQQLQQALPAAGGGVVELLSIEQVMERMDASRSTVQRWIKNGKTGRDGILIKLQVYHFSPTEPRIPWPALAAFGQGLPFDLTTLNFGAKAAPPAAGAAPRRGVAA